MFRSYLLAGAMVLVASAASASPNQDRTANNLNAAANLISALQGPPVVLQPAPVFAAPAEPVTVQQSSGEVDTIPSQGPRLNVYTSPAPTRNNHAASATFTDVPEVTIQKVAKMCFDRGFAVRQISADDVICQAGGMMLGQPNIFNPSMFAAQPANDPRRTKQVYAHFVAFPDDQGTTILAASVYASMPWFGNFSTTHLAGYQANGQLREFYRALGGVPQ